MEVKSMDFKKIKCGKLYDGVKQAFQEDMEILVEGRKIKDIKDDN